MRTSMSIVNSDVDRVHQGSAGVSDIWTVIKFSYDVSSKIIEGKSAYALLTDRTSQKLDDIYSAVQNIMRDQQMIAKRLEANVQKMMNNLRKQIRNDVEFDRLREKITQEYIARINNIHKTFTDAIDRNYNNITMCDLAIETTSFGSHEIHDSLGKTSQLIFTEGTMSSYFSNFIDILLEHTQGETKDRCNKGMSQQQEVYQFYELLVETEKKAFTVLSLAYSFKSRCLKANFENELKGVQTDMIKRVVQYMKIIKKAMAKVSTEIRRCEPTEYIRNENFIELERYIRMIIMPENETETFPVPSKCSGTCNEYHKIGAPFFGSEVSRRHTILAQNCEKCESIGYTQICYPKDENTSRYYEGVKANIPNSTPNSEYGHFSKCYTRRQETFIKDVDSFFYTIGAMCDMCACKCLNPEPNQKWLYSIYLRGQEADIANNMVVTGIRFNHRHAEHTGHLIYPEIKVGKLLPYGEVTDGEWQGFQGPDYPFQPLDFRTDQYATFGTLPDQIHYVNLDNAFADPGQVVVVLFLNCFQCQIEMEIIGRKYITVNQV
ncbi:hypothetical protein PV327_009176 [Microctonus hyperodae]|uniref:Uncharacterized protein n=1 Tax=Microctonus hyperodae TaxID=165561 RepID=A0AA39FT82_MICHY|nr:hypothetical protein PV327_009176 [Microctonus hyperodae]